MKYALLLLVTLSAFTNLSAQSLSNHNPAVKNPEMGLSAENLVKLRFEFVQEFSSYLYDPNLKQLGISICLEHITPNISQLNNTSDKFNWTYKKASNCFFGIQNDDLTRDEIVPVTLSGKLDKSITCDNCSGMIGFNVNIQPVPSMNGVNVRKDDNLGLLVPKKDLKPIK